MKPIRKLQMGKNGLSSEFVEQVRTFFEKSELIKIDLLKSACRDKEKARKMGEELVSALGDKFTYKLIGYVLSVRKWRKMRG